MGSRQMAFGDESLEAFPVPALAEVGVAEPALERLDRIEPLGAPRAAAFPAVRVAQPDGEIARPESLFDVGRDDGIAPRYGEPG